MLFVVSHCFGIKQWQPTYLKGLAFVFITAVIWVASSFLVKEIDKELGPFQLTYIANSLFSLYLPICLLYISCQPLRKHLSGIQGRESPSHSSAESVSEAQELDEQVAVALTNSAGSVESLDKRYTSWDTLKAAIIVAPLWFLAQFTFNASLSFTSVSSNTVISSAASIFTFLGSVIFLGETFTVQKLGCVLLCMSGTICVGAADGGSGARAGLWGDLLSLLSTVFYASYTLAIKHHLPEDEAYAMSQFFGFMGLIIMVGLAPLLLVLALAGRATLLAAGPGTYGWAVLKGLFDNVLTDYLWARAVILVGPTVATLGLSIQIPMAIAVDLLFHQSAIFHSGHTLALNVAGAMFVVLGFVGINMPEDALPNAMRRVFGRRTLERKIEEEEEPLSG